MKKSFLLFALFALFMVVISCSKNSNPEPPLIEKHLALTSNKTEVEIEDEVTFVVQADGEIIKDATLYINNEKISNPFRFKQAGTYNVIAKKENYKDSNTVLIQVKEAKPKEKKLVLSSDKSTVFEGERVTFTVKDDKNQEVQQAVIKLNGTSVGSSWVAKSPGTYNFIASKEGYTSSEVLTIVVKDEEATAPNYFTFKGQTYALDKASFHYIGDKLGEGGLYDIYRMDLSNDDSFKNFLSVNVEFKRPESTQNQETYPRNGKHTITPYKEFKLTTFYTTHLNTFTDNGSYVDLSSIFRQDTKEQYIKVVKNGKIVFSIETMEHKTMTKQKIEGEYKGEIFIYTKK